jgi:hypothetical protein
MRGTLHLLPSRELPLWHAALGTNPRYLKPALWKKYFGITPQELDLLTEAIGTALDGRLMTRGELAQEVARLTSPARFAEKITQSSWGTILRPAAFTGRLCFGPSAGQRVTFTRPDTWLAAAIPKMDPEAATADVARRFLAAYGPATFHDLARWWGDGGVATARQRIASLGDEVTEVDLDGTKAWMLAADARKVRDLVPARSVNLLPAFDQYVIAASRYADQLLPTDLRSRVYRPQGWISPVLLVNGFMRGTWRYEIKSRRVEVVIEPFGKTPAWVRTVAAQEVERLATFLGGTLSFAWR